MGFRNRTLGQVWRFVATFLRTKEVLGRQWVVSGEVWRKQRNVTSESTMNGDEMKKRFVHREWSSNA